MLLLFLLSLNGLLQYCSAQQGPFQLITSRGAGINQNQLALNCRDVNLIDYPNLFYWIDSTQRELRNILGEEKYSQNSQGFNFVITRELEGLYFCGSDVNTISGMEPLIAFPLISSQLESKKETVRIGSDAVLNPLVLPGSLLAQYYVDWLDNSSQTIGRIQGPRRSLLPLDPNSRYFVNPETFALTIQSVSFDDRGIYFGVVGVADPAGQMFLYTQTQRLGVTLDVYVPPTFMEPPDSQVVVLSTSDANQLVTIRGYPSLEISWKHNGKEILRNGNKYILNFSRVEDTIFESSFAIQSLDNYDSGNVTCTGTIRPGDGESKTTATAFLSVLGEVQRLSTFITVSQTIIFRVFLEVPIPAEVQLFIKYTDIDTGDSFNTITLSHFTQSQEITHFDDMMPYQRFTVDVALMHQSNTGPLKGDQVTHDRSLPTELSIILVTFLVPGLFLLLALIIIAIVVIVLLCLCFGRKKALEYSFKANTKGAQTKFVDDNLPGQLTLNQVLEALKQKSPKIPSEETNGKPAGAVSGPTYPCAMPPEEEPHIYTLAMLPEEEPHIYTPVTTRRESSTTKRRWRPFCFRESAEEKETKNTFKTIKELLKPSITYTMVNSEDAADTRQPADIEETVI